MITLLYNRHKQELVEIFDDIPEGTRIRIGCQWYQKGKKSNKLFLNLEKKARNQRSNTKTYGKRERNI